MVTAIRQTHQRSPLRLKLDINSKTVVQVKEHRVLGITVDDEFKWHSHVSNICKTASKKFLNVTAEAVRQLSNPSNFL